PTNDIFSLYKAYIALDHPVGAKVTADSLSTLLKYQMIKSKYFIDLYSTIKPKMQSFLEESAESALVIMDWLQKASEVLKKGDDISFGDLLNKTFADLIFVKRDEEKFRAFWNDVKASKYAIALAAYMLSPNTFIEYGEYARAFTPSEGIAFALIILECSAVLENLDPEDLTAIADYGLKSSIKDSNEFPRKIYNALEKAFNKDKGKMQNALMSILLDNSSNKDYCEYIINMRVKMDGDLLSSPQIMESFFDELTQGPLQGYYGAALRSVANHIGFNYISKLINLMKKYSQKTFGETERAAFESLDKKLSSLDSAYCNIARVIYTQRPDLAKCPNSAHLYALHIIDYADLVSEEFKRIDRRDFPLIEDNQGFIQDFISSFINRNMDPDTARDVISRLMENKTYFKVLVPSIVKEAISIDGVKFRSLIGLVSQRTGTYVETVLQEELSKFKDKDIKELTGILEKREKEYFKDLMKQSRKPNSGFPKIWPNK
ncbi:MAG: hypothetical protein LBT59_16845, partial [Clostridiales bacterium]|nr:hypothetical protein [Clostridiales bacterium]